MADRAARLTVRLTPGSSCDRVDGWEVDGDGRAVLKMRVRARPVDGAANNALLRLVAKTLDVPLSAITLERGGQSRLKRLSIAGLDEEELKKRMGRP